MFFLFTIFRLWLITMFRKNEQKRLAYQMLVFDEVVNQGSFTAAAEALGHTKSAVSQYVSQLEQDLGVKLLIRSTRQLHLTAQGEAMAQRSQQLWRLLTETLEAAHAQQAVPAGRVAITAPLAFEAPLLTPIIADLCREFPQLLPEMHYDDARLDILQHNLDMAISVGPQKDSGYHAIPIGWLDSVLVAAPSYINLSAPITPQNLHHHSLILLPWQRPLVLEGPDALAFTTGREIRLNTSISAINSAINGLGIALVPSIFIQAELAEGKLQRVLPEHRGPSREVFAIHAYQQQLPLVLRLVVDRLKEAFRQKAPGSV